MLLEWTGSYVLHSTLLHPYILYSNCTLLYSPVCTALSCTLRPSSSGDLALLPATLELGQVEALQQEEGREPVLLMVLRKPQQEEQEQQEQGGRRRSRRRRGGSR